MKTGVISYSHTGNNGDLARSLAAALQAEHVTITEAGRRSMGTILLDMILNRTPRVRLPLEEVERCDLILFVGPVWMGQVAAPFRACFTQLRSRIGKYAFISLSGGADGPNLKVAGELKRRLEREPVSVIDLHIADLLPPEPKPQRKDTMAYRISESELRKLTDTVVATLGKSV